MIRSFLFSFIFLSSLASTPLLYAQSRTSSEALIEKRVKLIKDVARKTSVIGKMLRKKIPFDLKQARDAVVFSRKAVAEFMTLFPEGSGTGKTRASPRIWSERAGFDQHGKNFADVTSVFLAKVADETTFRATASRLFTPCKKCHDTYRMPK